MFSKVRHQSTNGRQVLFRLWLNAWKTLKVRKFECRHTSLARVKDRKRKYFRLGYLNHDCSRISNVIYIYKFVGLHLNDVIPRSGRSEVEFRLWMEYPIRWESSTVCTFEWGVARVVEWKWKEFRLWKTYVIRHNWCENCRVPASVYR